MKNLTIDNLTISSIENGHVEITVYDEYTLLNETEIKDVIEFLQKQLEK